MSISRPSSAPNCKLRLLEGEKTARTWAGHYTRQTMGLSLDQKNFKSEKFFSLDNFRPKLMTRRVLKVVGRLWQLGGVKYAE